MKKEFFREIPGFNNYLASSEGYIYSKSQEQALLSYISRKGYVSVTLTNDDGVRTSRSVCKLIAEAFIETPQSPPDCPVKWDVRHIDGNRDNNHVTNLEWVSMIFTRGWRRGA